MLVRTTPSFKAVWSVAGVLVLILGVVMLPPLAFAQEARQTQTAEPRQGESQGTQQGASQGAQNGGPTLSSLGLTPDENGQVDTSVLGANDPRQGASQGVVQSQGVSPRTPSAAATAGNTQTGADSTNTSGIDISNTGTTSIDNTSNTTTMGTAVARTGENTASENTGSSGISTGTANSGVQQVTVDNLTTTGSSGEIEHNLSAGGQQGDLILNFDPTYGPSSLGQSFRSTNTVTGSGSDNTAEITSTRDVLTEVENDGRITTSLGASAVSGENEASQNTGHAVITTGNANVAATVFNFLNATVVDGALWLSVSDVFGDLTGNVVIPGEAVAYLSKRERELLVDATNSQTGSDSTNTLEVDLTDTRTTTLENDATVDTTMNVEAVTGENTATQNTGGSTITTGDVTATLNTVTLANLNVVDGSLGVVIVNALNRWMGYLLGSDGFWTPIDHDFSTIEVANARTGSDSTNEASVDVTHTDTTTITNDANVETTLDLEAITGRNTAMQNTGNAAITTGDARVNATVLNVVNTNVVRGGFFAAIVNVFGNWLGDLIFGGQSVGALASSSGSTLGVTATNEQTGADSTNTVEVTVDTEETVEVDNTAEVTNTFVVDADTGHNTADRNTGLAQVNTGDVVATVHARTAANLTVVGAGSGWDDITAELDNATTGADSTNLLDVTVNDERHVTVLNDANVDTAIGAVANTGFNTASRNTLGGAITTGSADVRPLIENLLNQTWLIGEEYGDDPRIGAFLRNRTTGSGSTNTTSFVPTNLTEVDLTNSADLTNDLAASATTGGNEASRNTGGGAVRSGNAAVRGGGETTVNQTEILGQLPGSVDLASTNSALIANDATVLSSSGGNDVSRNTGTLALGGTTLPSATSPATSGNASTSSAPASSDTSGGSSSASSSPAVLSGMGGGSIEAGERSPVSSVAKKKRVARAKASVKRPAPPTTVQGSQTVATAPQRLWGLAEANTPSKVVAAAASTLKLPGVAEVQAAGTPVVPVVQAPSDFAQHLSAGEVARRVWPWAALVAAAGIMVRLLLGGKPHGLKTLK